MRVAFLGTPAFAVPALDALTAAGHHLAVVVAQPDRPAGRGQELREPATKAWARGHGVPVLQPEKVRDGRLAAALGGLSLDVLVGVAYGRILGTDLLRLAPQGALNVHASLLPRWRGAAPIQWAIAAGDRETGVTIMQMDEGLDTGDVLLQRTCPVGDDDAEALAPRLAALGGAALVEALDMLEGRRLVPVRQDGSKVTLAPVLTREHGRLDFAEPAPSLACRVRAFRPWPGTFTTLEGRPLKVHAAEPRGDAGLAPGTARGTEGGLMVGCGASTALLLTEVQQEGKRRIRATEFLQGHPLPLGTLLGA
jgi:methionyl-tRNA formyltransferase